jgi:hypothetical protein
MKMSSDEEETEVEQTLNDLVAKRGIYDYLVVCDESNNTNDRIDRNELYVDVAIINIMLEDCTSEAKE